MRGGEPLLELRPQLVEIDRASLAVMGLRARSALVSWSRRGASLAVIGLRRECSAWTRDTLRFRRGAAFSGDGRQTSQGFCFLASGKRELDQHIPQAANVDDLSAAALLATQETKKIHECPDVCGLQRKSAAVTPFGVDALSR